MSAWTDDRGRLSRRVASIKPAELHQALAGAAIEGFRHGLSAELLDGHEAARNGRSLGYQIDRRQTRLEHLDEQIGHCEREVANARRNANLTDDIDLARQFMDDAADAQRRAVRMRQEREDLGDAAATLGNRFTSEAEYVAHGLARLATVADDTDGAVGDALSRILTITAMDTTTAPGHVIVTFSLMVPADGLVAKLGPLTCRVANRAYSGTLGHSLPPSISEHPLVVAAETTACSIGSATPIRTPSCTQSAKRSRPRGIRRSRRGPSSGRSVRASTRSSRRTCGATPCRRTSTRTTPATSPGPISHPYSAGTGGTTRSTRRNVKGS